MVVGLQRFRDHFRAHTGAFVLIGGAACDAWMTANALTFRRTKDLDIVLVADAVDATFAERFKAFVDEGGYEVRQRQESGKREFFRFYKPKGDDYPFMLELFSRAPAGLDVWPGQQIVPVPVEESVASLSAILMDEGYYGLVLATRYVDDGIPMVAAAGLVPLKAKAWLDLQARNGAGQHVDEDDIKKHRNDVFRLALTLTGEPVEIAEGIRADLAAFLAAFPDGTADWPSIASALQATTRSKTQPPLEDLRQAITTYFRLD